MYYKQWQFTSNQTFRPMATSHIVLGSDHKQTTILWWHMMWPPHVLSVTNNIVFWTSCSCTSNNILLLIKHIVVDIYGLMDVCLASDSDSVIHIIPIRKCKYILLSYANFITNWMVRNKAIQRYCLEYIYIIEPNCELKC